MTGAGHAVEQMGSSVKFTYYIIDRSPYASASPT